MKMAPQVGFDGFGKEKEKKREYRVRWIGRGVDLGGAVEGVSRIKRPCMRFSKNERETRKKKKNNLLKKIKAT